MFRTMLWALGLVLASSGAEASAETPRPHPDLMAEVGIGIGGGNGGLAGGLDVRGGWCIAPHVILAGRIAVDGSSEGHLFASSAFIHGWFAATEVTVFYGAKLIDVTLNVGLGVGRFKHGRTAEPCLDAFGFGAGGGCELDTLAEGHSRTDILPVASLGATVVLRLGVVGISLGPQLDVLCRFAPSRDRLIFRMMGPGSRSSRPV